MVSVCGVVFVWVIPKHSIGVLGAGVMMGLAILVLGCDSESGG